MGKDEDSSRQEEEQGQYTARGIQLYETVYGKSWVSPGGEVTNEEIVGKLRLSRDQRVLDVGCGSGGNAFFMARRYGARVLGVELSSNMLQLATQTKNTLPIDIQNKVEFVEKDALLLSPEDHGVFDLVFSRDTILHIHNKELLFTRLKEMLRDGGKLFITDYCKGKGDLNDNFLKYVEKRGYDLRTVDQYKNVLIQCGYKSVQAEDMSSKFLNILKEELKKLMDRKAEILKEFTQKEFDSVVEGWKSKIINVEKGYHVWGHFSATK